MAQRFHAKGIYGTDGIIELGLKEIKLKTDKTNTLTLRNYTNDGYANLDINDLNVRGNLNSTLATTTEDGLMSKEYATKLEVLDEDIDKFRRAVTQTDINGNPITITYSRNDSTLYMVRTYSNLDEDGNYQTCVESYKDTNGTTIIKTYTFSLTFLPNGLINTCERVVS